MQTLTLLLRLSKSLEQIGLATALFTRAWCTINVPLPFYSRMYD